MNSKSNKNANYSIGQAVKRLKESNPTISISKIRYLEDEGLISVSRTKGGYRQFTDNDLAKLEEILRLQRDHFLPLQVIKKKMDSWTIGKNSGALPPKNKLSKEDAYEKEELLYKPVKLEDALKKINLTMDDVKSLENYGLLNIDATPEGNFLGTFDFQILKTYKALAKFGIEPRHLRIYENFSNKETNLFRQILAPHLSHKSKKKRDKSIKELKNLIDLTGNLQNLLRERDFEKLKLN